MRNNNKLAAYLLWVLAIICAFFAMGTMDYADLTGTYEDETYVKGVLLASFSLFCFLLGFIFNNSNK